MPRATRGRRPPPNPRKYAAPRHVHAPSATAVAERAEDTPETQPTRPIRAATASTGASRRPSAYAPPPRRRFADSVADYAYVASDLRTIGILAGGLVIMLVALSFVVR